MKPIRVRIKYAQDTLELLTEILLAVGAVLGTLLSLGFLAALVYWAILYASCLTYHKA